MIMKMSDMANNHCLPQSPPCLHDRSSYPVAVPIIRGGKHCPLPVVNYWRSLTDVAMIRKYGAEMVQFETRLGADSAESKQAFSLLIFQAFEQGIEP